MTQAAYKGITVNNTYLLFYGLEKISPILNYYEIVKDGKGKKHKIIHNYFELHYRNDYEKVRVEQGNGQPHRDSNDPHTLIVFSDEPLDKVREKIIKQYR